jgi:hypothetical protein
MSPDPLTVHGLASDPNPYSYVSGKVMAAIDVLGLQGEGDNAPPSDVTCELCPSLRVPAGNAPTAPTEITLEETTVVGNREPPQWLTDYMLSGLWEENVQPESGPPEQTGPPMQPFLPYDTTDPLSRWINTGEDPFAGAGLYLAGEGLAAGSIAAGPAAVAGLLRLQAITAEVNAGLTTGGIAAGTGIGVGVRRRSKYSST